MTNAADVIVVGGGLTGLVAGVTAAHGGRRVVVLEARTSLGGRARTREQGGFLLNEGAHALYLGGEALPILRGLGVEPTGAPPATKGSLGLRGGTLGLLPAGPAALVRSPLLGARAKVGLGRLLAGLARIDPDPLSHRTLASWLDEVAPEPDARAVLASVIRTSTYADDPGHVSAGAVVLQLQRALGAGVRYLDGGWQTLVDGVRAVALDAGVELRTGAKVTRVLPGPAVVVDGEEEPASTVIVAGLSSAAFAGLVGDASPAAAGWAGGVRPSRVAALDICLAGPWDGAAHLVLGIDEPVYLSVHSVARVAPAGATLVSLMKYLDPDAPTEVDADRRQLESLLELVRPSWRSDAVDATFRHRLVAATDTPQAATGGLAGRPGAEVPDLAGVLVAGDWVGPSGLLTDASLASAVAAGRVAAEVPLAA